MWGEGFGGSHRHWGFPQGTVLQWAMAGLRGPVPLSLGAPTVSRGLCLRPHTFPRTRLHGDKQQHVPKLRKAGCWRERTSSNLDVNGSRKC